MMENASVITMFYLSGLNETRAQRSFLFFLAFLCYLIILLLNISIVVTVVWDKNLHEPLYILLCAFCINALYGTMGFFPKFLWDLVSPIHVISYSGCLLQAWVMYCYACSDLSILAVMAYDRYVAICRPLEYHCVMSKRRLTHLLCYSWLTPFCVIGTNICLTSSLRLCSPNITRLFCVNWIIVKLACQPADTMVNNIVAYLTICIYVLHGVFICLSYVYLIRNCVNSMESRAKFMQTCVPHVLSLFTFLFTLLFDIMYIRYGSKNLPQTFRNFVEIEFVVFAPLMNPLIYGFKLTKIRRKFLGQVTCKVR